MIGKAVELFVLACLALTVLVAGIAALVWEAQIVDEAFGENLSTLQGLGTMVIYFFIITGIVVSIWAFVPRFSETFKSVLVAAKSSDQDSSSEVGLGHSGYSD